jgi:outer membrane protein assembly factor BamE
VTPYRIEIQQGNFVSQEMVSQLKPGMTREQVRFVLGTPLVADIFHADRWDYPYYRDVPGKPREQRKFSVFFEDGKLARVTGDVVPAATPVPAPAKPAAAAPAPVAQPAAVAAPRPEDAPPGQNWNAASDAPDYGKEARPAPEAAKPAAETPAERGFFGRMIDRIKGN